MSLEITYKIRFFHGVKNLKNDPVYSFKDISEAEYLALKDELNYQLFLINLEKAYELIVFNYRDYELNNFSIILNYETVRANNSMLRSSTTSIDRHLSNILTSTYLYTCFLRINSDDLSLSNVLSLKEKFQKLTNNYHATQYQYTFMSALRNKLNHGGSLEKMTILGGTWSSFWEKSDDDENFLIAKKDKKFSLLDMEISKEEAKKIIDNNKHYNSIKDSMPDSFYLRQAIRIYVSLISQAHAELRIQREASLNDSIKLIRESLAISDHFIHASLVKYIFNEEKEKTNLFSYYEQAYKNADIVHAPLSLEYYQMPGEYEDRPTLYKNT